VFFHLKPNHHGGCNFFFTKTKTLFRQFCHLIVAQNPQKMILSAKEPPASHGHANLGYSKHPDSFENGVYTQLWPADLGN
jgi:hypothetical protein